MSEDKEIEFKDIIEFFRQIEFFYGNDANIEDILTYNNQLYNIRERANELISIGMREIIKMSEEEK